MAKPFQEITKTEFRTNYNVVKILTSLKQAMEYIKTLKDNNNQAVAFGVKKTGTDQAPAWFREFATKVETFMVEQKKFNEDQQKFNEEVKNFITEQKKFNREQKEFNETIVRLNNLKTA